MIVFAIVWQSTHYCCCNCCNSANAPVHHDNNTTLAGHLLFIQALGIRFSCKNWRMEKSDMSPWPLTHPWPIRPKHDLHLLVWRLKWLLMCAFHARLMLPHIWGPQHVQAYVSVHCWSMMGCKCIFFFQQRGYLRAKSTAQAKAIWFKGMQMHHAQTFVASADKHRETVKPVNHHARAVWRVCA